MHLVVFDVDGTLTRTDSVDEACYVAAVAEVLSISAIDTDWTHYPHVTDSGILRQVVQSSLGRDVLPEEMDRVCQCFLRRLEDAFRGQPDSCLPVEGGPGLLKELASQSDVAVALATGGWESTARLKLEWAGYDITDLPLASSSDADAREEILRIAEQRARARYGAPNTITYVGDGVWDARAATSLGWRFLGVGTGPIAVINQYSSGSFLAWIRNR